MRPRISKREAQFLAELLEAAIKDIELKQEYEKELDKAVFRLKLQISRGAGYEVFREGYYEKKKELDRWKNRLGYLAYHELDTAKRLLEKYKAIAVGEKHRGTYKHLNCRVEHSIFPNDTGKLKEILEKQLEPIEDLGKHQTLKEQCVIQ